MVRKQMEYRKPKHLPTLVVMGIVVGSVGLFALSNWQSPSAVSGEELLKDQSNPEVLTHKDEFRKQYNPDEKTLRPLYEEFVDLIGVNGMLDVMEEQYCHGQGHDLGKLVFERTKDLSASMYVCSNRCTAGCMHGILMGMFGTKGEHVSLERVITEAKAVCSTKEITSTNKVGDCIHGVGHVISELVGGDIDTGIKYCQELNPRPFQHFCATGIFMQRDLDFGLEDAGRGHFPCDQYPFSAACYRYKAKYLISHEVGEQTQIDALINICLGLEGTKRSGCFHGAGFTFLPYLLDNPSGINHLCGAGTKVDRTLCIEGAIETLAEHDPAKAREICNELPDLREQCFYSAEHAMFSLDKSWEGYF